MVSACFGALAAFLACPGIYGLVSYTAAHRTNEIGIRIALGATRTDVLAMIIGESMLLMLVGVTIGVPATVAVTRLISARLFGVSPTDPLTITAAIALMAAVAAFAGFLPALRASKSDPTVALRYD